MLHLKCKSTHHLLWLGPSRVKPLRGPSIDLPLSFSPAKPHPPGRLKGLQFPPHPAQTGLPSMQAFIHLPDLCSETQPRCCLLQKTCLDPPGRAPTGSHSPPVYSHAFSLSFLVLFQNGLLRTQFTVLDLRWWLRVGGGQPCVFAHLCTLASSTAPS